jgi:hypothetical protein
MGNRLSCILGTRYEGSSNATGSRRAREKIKVKISDNLT